MLIFFDKTKVANIKIKLNLLILLGLSLLLSILLRIMFMYFNLQNSTTITWIFLFGVNDQKARFFDLEPKGVLFDLEPKVLFA